MSCIFVTDDVINGICTEYEVGDTNQNIAFYGWPHVFSCIELAINNLYYYEGEEILSNVGRSCRYACGTHCSHKVLLNINSAQHKLICNS